MKISWILSLILCLATLVISPSAQAAQKWEITSPNLKFQSGDLYHGYEQNPEKWNLNDGTGKRKFTGHVKFKDAYDVEPSVAVFMTGMDGDKNSNTRITVTPIKVTEKGFDVEYKTWADSQIYSVWSTWTALGK